MLTNYETKKSTNSIKIFSCVWIKTSLWQTTLKIVGWEIGKGIGEGSVINGGDLWIGTLNDGAVYPYLNSCFATFGCTSPATGWCSTFCVVCCVRVSLSGWCMSWGCLMTMSWTFSSCASAFLPPQIRFPISSRWYRRIDDAIRAAFVAVSTPILSSPRLFLAASEPDVRFSPFQLFYRPCLGGIYVLNNQVI